MESAAPAPDPSQLEFVLSPDSSGVVVRRRDEYDLYLRPSGADAPLMVFAHGPVRDAAARPREWPVYRGYGVLAANAGAGGVITDLDYTDVRAVDGPTTQLQRIIDAARHENGVASSRVAIWAFSGGARLVGPWLEAPPEWLRGIAMTYPVAPMVTRVGTPVVLTRVGIERPEIQLTVDQLLAVAPSAEVIEVPSGHHGFDMLDHNAESRAAVARALDEVAALLA